MVSNFKKHLKRKVYGRPVWLVYLLLFISLILPVSVFAAPTSYSFYIPISVLSNSTTSYTNLPVLASINNTQLKALGYSPNDGLDIYVTQGGTEVYSAPMSNKTAFMAASLLAYQPTAFTQTLKSLPLKTTNTIMSGYGGTITTADHASLEPGASDYEIRWKGYVDTSVAGNIFYKANEYGLYSNGDGTIKYSTNIVTSSTSFVPTGNGASNSMPLASPSVAHYLNVDDPIGAPDTTSYLYTGNPETTGVEYYTWTNTLGTSITPTSFDVFTSWKSCPGDWAQSTPRLYLLGSVTSGSATSDSSGSYVNNSQNLTARPGGGSWSGSDLTNLQFGFYAEAQRAGYPASWTQCYLTVNYFYTTTDSHAVTSGYHDIKISKSGGTCKLYVDDMVTEVDSVAEGAVTDTSASLLMNGTVAKYCTYAEVKVGGVQKLLYQPTTIITPTNLPDASGNGNTGVITLGANPAGVEVTVGSITGLTSYVYGGGNETSSSNYTLPNAPNMYENTTAPVTGLLAYELVNNTATQLGWTAYTMYGILMFFTAFSMGFAGLVATKSILIGGALLSGTLGLAAGTGVIPPWMPIFTLIMTGLGCYVLRHL